MVVHDGGGGVGGDGGGPSVYVGACFARVVVRVLLLVLIGAQLSCKITTLVPQEHIT